MLTRRGFLKRLGLGAGVAVTGAALAKEAESIFGMGHEIDYEKLLYLPGQKALVDLGGVKQATEQETDQVLAEAGTRIPRFHLTIGGRGTYLFDNEWKLLDGPELRGRTGRDVTAAEVLGLEHELFGNERVHAAKALIRSQEYEPPGHVRVASVGFGLPGSKADISMWDMDKGLGVTDKIRPRGYNQQVRVAYDNGQDLQFAAGEPEYWVKKG